MGEAFPAPKPERMEKSAASLCKLLRLNRVSNLVERFESPKRSALDRTKCRTMHIRCTHVPREKVFGYPLFRSRVADVILAERNGSGPRPRGGSDGSQSCFFESRMLQIIYPKIQTGPERISRD